MGKVARLIMVTEFNNNKFYNMTEDQDGATFTVEFGRVDSSSQKTTYPMSQWDSKLKSKLKKGYKDVTDLVSIEESGDNGNDDKDVTISDNEIVKNLILELQGWAKATIQKNYKISSNNVTQKMVDKAQELIDKLSLAFSNGKDFKELNKIILEIYTTIPRKMNNVESHLLKDDNVKVIKELIDNEQKLLDTMAGQVMSVSATTETKKDVNNTKPVNLLEQLSLKINPVTDNVVLASIETLMGESKKFMGNVYEVTNTKTQVRYDEVLSKTDVKNEQLLFHGSRNQNWFNIIQTGLLIRPSGAVYTGSMFGDGIYFANKAKKSIGYSSLKGSYWTKGSENKSYLALFSVNLGKFKDVLHHTSECYKFSKTTIHPYNSVYAHGGADLRNDEFIIYDTSQCTIKYLIEIKR